MAMKKMSPKMDAMKDKKAGIKPGSKRDNMLDKKRGVSMREKKGY